jgi:hypothetical protein
MKRFLIFTLLLVGCAGQASVLDLPEVHSENLIIVGEGGPSVSLFIKSAETYKREFGGEIYQVRSGDEFIEAFADFLNRYDEIEHFEYFGHGNNVGLFVNQSPGINGGVYANDPGHNEGFVAASIYELPADIFAVDGSMKFNGCNIADGYPESHSLAQSFANYFDAEVVAAMGPTEFSLDPHFPDPLPEAKYLPSDFSEDLYMVPTYSDQGFITINAQERSVYEDVRLGESYEKAVRGMSELGFRLEEGEQFFPYWNGTYANALEFCSFLVSDLATCELEGYELDQKIRNLQFLRMLTDATGVEVGWTDPWYNGYINWAVNRDLLTEDFVNKMWYTRGEMAELTWSFYEEVL